MIAVSESWKAAQAGILVPVTDISITYTVTEPFLQDDATTSGDPAESWSRPGVIADLEADKSTTKVATLEWNMFRLDGSFVLKADDYQEAGYVSSVLCDGQGVFQVVPTVTISFSEVHTGYLPGMKFTWNETLGEYATRFRIRSWNGSTQLSEHLVEGNTKVVVNEEFTIQGYNKVTIEILAWSKPYRRARMSEVFLGLQQVYGKNDLLGYSHEQTADLLSAELPKNAIEFKLNNVDQRWNPDNPQGMERYLMERQTLVVKYGMEVNGAMEWINAGTFYMSEWDTPANGLEATFTARDLLEFCSDDYTGTKTGTLAAIAKAALAQALITEEQYVLDAALAGISTDFSAESAMSIAEVLQLVANAGQCCMWQDRDGILHIERLTETLTDYVIGRLTDSGASAMGAMAMGMDDDLDMGAAVPYSAVSNAYAHPEFTLSKQLKSVDVNEGMGVAVNSTEGNIQTLDNPLVIDTATANAVAEWCRNVLKNRKTVSGEFRADPRLDVLDQVRVGSRYGTSQVYVTNVRYDYNGAWRGSYEGRVVDSQ